jgi:hypothetical protein
MGDLLSETIGAIASFASSDPLVKYLAPEYPRLSLPNMDWPFVHHTTKQSSFFAVSSFLSRT